jgi:hypothetical protein
LGQQAVGILLLEGRTSLGVCFCDPGHATCTHVLLYASVYAELNLACLTAACVGLNLRLGKGLAQERGDDGAEAGLAPCARNECLMLDYALSKAWYAAHHLVPHLLHHCSFSVTEWYWRTSVLSLQLPECEGVRHPGCLICCKKYGQGALQRRVKGHFSSSSLKQQCEFMCGEGGHGTVTFNDNIFEGISNALEMSDNSIMLDPRQAWLCTC